VLQSIAVAVIFAVVASDPAPAASVCFGTTGKGRLEGGCQLPASGANFSPYAAQGVRQGRTYVHCAVADIVAAAYAALARQMPGVRFVYGETGKATGGPLPPHKTHQNGLSVDFFVPVRDAGNRSVRVPASSANRWGYDVEFDAQGRSNGLRIDFEALAAHLLALAEAAEARGVGIRRVYFDAPLQKPLQSTAAWSQLRNKVPFSKTRGWWRHDEHYHVDFELPCKPL
jgi:penicillin-insensitive murein endopeptidase